MRWFPKQVPNQLWIRTKMGDNGHKIPLCWVTFPFLSILTAPNETFNSLLRFLCWWHVHIHAANRYQILIKYPWKNNMFSFRGISSCFSCRNFQTSAFEVRSPSLYGPNPHSYWLNLHLPWWHLNSWCFFHVRSIFPGQHMLDSRFFSLAKFHFLLVKHHS